MLSRRISRRSVESPPRIVPAPELPHRARSAAKPASEQILPPAPPASWSLPMPPWIMFDDPPPPVKTTVGLVFPVICIGASERAIPLPTDGHGARQRGIHDDGAGEIEVNVVTESSADQDGVQVVREGRTASPDPVSVSVS